MATQPSSAEVEILVHVTAPSKVSDDATYRCLAQAYLSFVPRSRANVTIPTSPEPQQPPPSSPAAATLPQETPRHHDGLVVLQSFFHSDSQDISFQSALDNRSSPRLLVRNNGPLTPPPRVVSDPNVTTPTTAVRRLLPSQIADSYPMPDADMFNPTPTRLLQRYIASHAAPAVAPASSPTLSSDGRDDAMTIRHADVPQAPTTVAGISSSPPASGSSQARIAGSQRQATIPVTPLVPATSRKRKADEDNSSTHGDPALLDITHISSSNSNPSSSASLTAALQRSESDPLPPKRLCQDSGVIHLFRNTSDTISSHPNQQQPAPPPSSPLSYTGVSKVPSTHPAPSSSSTSVLSSLSIRPPSPPVGVANLSLASLVSSKLAKLAHDLSSRYRPTSPARRLLNPLERGYWLVDCSRWSADTRAEAWAFLTSYIRSGLAGWGVWCRRSPGWGGREADGGHAAAASIRLYGWAHVAKHTYLLLYLASGRQIKATGAQWIDAEGVVVLQVKP